MTGLNSENARDASVSRVRDEERICLYDRSNYIEFRLVKRMIRGISGGVRPSHYSQTLNGRDLRHSCSMFGVFSLGVRVYTMHSTLFVRDTVFV